MCALHVTIRICFITQIHTHQYIHLNCAYLKVNLFKLYLRVSEKCLLKVRNKILACIFVNEKGIHAFIIPVTITKVKRNEAISVA